MNHNNIEINPMRHSAVRLLTLTCVIALTSSADAASIVLGAADDFAVLASAAITNTGGTTIEGDVGLSPGSSVTGLLPVAVTGTIHVADGVAVLARADALLAFGTLGTFAPTQDLSGQDLGGLTLTPGVYTFSSSAQLTGALTLDAGNSPDALFVFRIGSSLTTASGASIVGINGLSSCNVFFQVGESATLGTDSAFAGSIIAAESITLNTRASLDGRAIALNGAITMDTNRIVLPVCIPETGASGLILLSGLLLGIRRSRVATA